MSGGALTAASITPDRSTLDEQRSPRRPFSIISTNVVANNPAVHYGRTQSQSSSIYISPVKKKLKLSEAELPSNNTDSDTEFQVLDPAKTTCTVSIKVDRQTFVNEQDSIPPLSQPIEALDGMLEGRSVTFQTVPVNGVDWTDGNDLNNKFPPINGLNIRQVPQCLLLDAVTIRDKLIVINLWRSLDKQEVLDLIKVLQKIYMTYTKSNKKLSNDSWLKIQKSIENDEKASACVKDTANVYVGAGDSVHLRKAGMNASASAKVKSKTARGNKRKKNEPPSTPSKLYDRRTVDEKVSMESAIERACQVTQKPEGATCEPVHHMFAMSYRTVGTPGANGKQLKDHVLRKKPKFEIFGRGFEPGMMEGEVGEKFQEFSEVAKKKWDVDIVPFGETPPTKKCRKKRKRPKRKSGDEIQKMLDEAVKNGHATQEIATISEIASGVQMYRIMQESSCNRFLLSYETCSQRPVHNFKSQG